MLSRFTWAVIRAVILLHQISWVSRRIPIKVCTSVCKFVFQKSGEDTWTSLHSMYYKQNSRLVNSIYATLGHITRLAPWSKRACNLKIFRGFVFFICNSWKQTFHCPVYTKFCSISLILSLSTSSVWFQIQLQDRTNLVFRDRMTVYGIRIWKLGILCNDPQDNLWPFDKV